MLVDPRCDRAEQKVVLVRGGSWNNVPLSAESARRDVKDDVPSPFVGFRCAKTM